MKTKICKSCGKEIAKNATVCPNCGYKYSKKRGCLTSILIFLIAFFLIIGYFASNEKSINSIVELAQRENAIVGKKLTLNRADTKTKNPDGSYIILNFNSIKKHEIYKTNIGKNINNAIVVENVTNLTVTRNFVKNTGYFVLFNEKGSEININNGIFTQKGKEFSEIIIPLKNKVELNKSKYLLIGGFDRSTHKGKDKLIFEIE